MINEKPEALEKLCIVYGKMASKMAGDNHLMVAAIDFGTTFSGWAYSFKHEFESDPTNIHAKNWNNGSNISTKAPTTVLIEPDGKTFVAFGYEAEDKYALLCAEGKQKEFYYFSRFKMMLHNKLDIEKKTYIEDAYGKPLLAREIFKHAIAFLRNDLKAECSKQLVGGIHDTDVLWVLTVPAIWNETAKRFMREAAEEAGIPSTCLRIALEPEAASLFCKTVAVEKKTQIDQKVSPFEPGAKYIVLDCGGGTVDVSVHEVLVDGNLRELYKASGGAWGGSTVNEAYEEMLFKIFGQSVFKKFKNDNMDDYIDMLRTFEVKKRGVSAKTENDTIVSSPSTLVEIYNDETEGTLKSAVSKSGLSGLVTPEKGNKLRIKAAMMKQMFSTAVNNTVEHVSKLLKIKVVSGTKTILMVGGLSESKILYDSLKASFTKLDIVVPAESALTVLKGAVMYGYNPAVITERMLNYTYGISVREPFQDGDDPAKLFVNNVGKRFCKDRFITFVECDQVIKLDQQLKMHRIYTPITSHGVAFKMFASTTKSPTYVTDEGCYPVGILNVDFDSDVPENLKKQFRLCGYFGEPEIRIIAEDIDTGERFSASFELPNK